MAGTAEKTELNTLPPVTLMLIVASTVSVFAFVLFGLYPQHKQIQAATESRLASILALETQKLMFPVYTGALALDKEEFAPRLAFPSRKAIERKRIADLSGIFGGIADDCGMELAGNTLDINSVSRNSGTVAVDVSLTGDLLSFRNYLLAIMELPFFNRLESVDISAGNGVKTFKTKFHIMIEKN